HDHDSRAFHARPFLLPTANIRLDACASCINNKTSSGAGASAAAGKSATGNDASMACGVENAFEGRRIAVSGGCGGIGRALVADLHRRGAQVLVLDLPQSLERHPPPAGVEGFAVDARDAGAVTRAFDALAGTVEALDGLVNLVGFAREKAPVAE